MQLIINRIITGKCDSCEADQFCAETADDQRLCYQCLPSYPHTIVGLVHYQESR